MEAVLVGVATGVMKPLLSKLTTLLDKEYAKFKGVHRDAQLLSDEMRSMGAALETLAEEEQLEGEVRVWRDDVRELSYDTEDCIDDFMARVDREPDASSSRLEAAFDWAKKFKPRVKIGNEIEEIKKRLIETSDRHKRYKIRQTPDSSSSSAIDPRLPALYEDLHKLVGIEGPKKHIIEWFEEGSSSQLKVLSIVGSGGLGKTTLANQVYHTIKHQFSYTAFVSVSRKPDIKKILRDLAKGVGIKDYASDDDVNQLIDRLREYLQDKRYFIVIDDVWDTKAWEIISLALLKNKCGSRVITTTRNIAVASCSSPQGNKVYQMEPLSRVDSQRLFFKRAFGSEDLCYPHLQNVSDKILEKCAGLPLAIITMSSLLADKTAVDEWQRVLDAIGSALAKDPDAETMANILSLSYFDLPHHLRTCLLYLSIFPEDYIIKKDILIHRWIAEGFIHKVQGRQAYEVGEGYFSDLINRSLIKPVDIIYGEAGACCVHDIILDFITCKATEENFVTISDITEHGNISRPKVRRLSVRSRNLEMLTRQASPALSHVRSVTIFGNFMQNTLLGMTSPAIRVLDLGECQGLENHHLANIEKLFLLKYLRLGGSGITELPRKIGELQYLETLDIQDTYIEILPPTIARLQRLACIYVPSHCMFPDGIIAQLQSLEVISKLNVICDKQAKYLQQIIQLTKMKALSVSFDQCRWTGEDMDLQSYVGVLIALFNLHHLHIIYERDACPHYDPLSLESLCPTAGCSLQSFSLNMCYIDKIPSWMRSHGNLRKINLSMYRLSSEDVGILEAIPGLVFLKLVVSYGRNGRISICGFRSLKYFNLNIACCGTALVFEEGSMPKLEHLKLQFKAHETKCVNDASDFGIQHLSALTKVQAYIIGISRTADKVASLIESAVGTLPNHPTLSLTRSRKHRGVCDHFEKHFNQWYEGLYDCTFRTFLGQLVEEINQDACNISRLRMLDETAK